MPACSSSLRCQKLEVGAEMVVQGILDSIESCKKAGTGAWQMQASSAAVNSPAATLACSTRNSTSRPDTAIIDQLVRGRHRAAGLPEDEEEKELPELLKENDAEKKPH